MSKDKLDIDVNEFALLLAFSFRYSIRRHSYASALVADIIERTLPQLGTANAKKLKKLIEEEFLDVCVIFEDPPLEDTYNRYSQVVSKINEYLEVQK